MQVGGYSGYGISNAYMLPSIGTVGKVNGLQGVGVNTSPVEPVKKIQPVEEGSTKITDPNKARIAAISGHEDQVDPMELKALKRAGIIKCNTCASRTYQDGSDESNVSFKTAAHVDPAQSEAAVAQHEGMHVKNAVSKAATSSNDTLVSASVSIKYATCPECGRRYAAGGLTTTQMSHSEESPETPKAKPKVNNNPYAKNQKSLDEMALKGAFVDTAA